MKKVFIKKKFDLKLSKRSSHWKTLWIIICAFLAVIALAAGLYVYYVKDSPLASSTTSSVYARVTTWMQDRNTRLQKNLVKVKQLAVNNKEPQQEIHFEFYTALPKMRIPVPSVDKPVTSVRMVSFENNSVNVSALPKKVKPSKVAKSDAFFDAGHLQDSLKQEFDKADTKMIVRRVKFKKKII